MQYLVVPRKRHPASGRLIYASTAGRRFATAYGSHRLWRGLRRAGFSDCVMSRSSSSLWDSESLLVSLPDISTSKYLSSTLLTFALAWMVAAFLPLPPKPVIEMFQPDGSATGLGISKQEAEAAFDGRVASIDDTKFQNARWWRNLNRIMSVVGLLILGTIIALVVVGTRQGWGKT